MDRKSASSSGVEIDAVIGDPHPMRMDFSRTLESRVSIFLTNHDDDDNEEVSRFVEIGLRIVFAKNALDL